MAHEAIKVLIVRYAPARYDLKVGPAVMRGF